MRAKQKQTCSPFPFLITELCHKAGVPLDTTRYIEAIPSSSTEIQHIENEYIREESDKRRPAPTYISPKIDVDLLSTNVVAPTSIPRLSGTSLPPSLQIEVLHPLDSRSGSLVPWSQR